MSTTGTITQPQLESYLWGAVTLLRGLIDAGDYKQFSFPLLFFKRTCDGYDEESAGLREELDRPVVAGRTDVALSRPQSGRVVESDSDRARRRAAVHCEQ